MTTTEHRAIAAPPGYEAVEALLGACSGQLDDEKIRELRDLAYEGDDWAGVDWTLGALEEVGGSVSDEIAAALHAEYDGTRWAGRLRTLLARLSSSRSS